MEHDEELGVKTLGKKEKELLRKVQKGLLFCPMSYATNTSNE